MALLAGPPRRDENKEEVVALVRRRLCLVPQSPYTTSVTQEPSEGTPNCCLRARILDSVLSGSSKRRPYFHPSAWKVHSRNSICRILHREPREMPIGCLFAAPPGQRADHNMWRCTINFRLPA